MENIWIGVSVLRKIIEKYYMITTTTMLIAQFWKDTDHFKLSNIFKRVQKTTK